MPINPDTDYIKDKLFSLLDIPSPTGYTDNVVRYIGHELEQLGVPFELTRRGAIRATLKGKERQPARAIVTHLDTLGAMVRELKPNGRLAITMIGHWSARFAEGARVQIFTDTGKFTGTILPLKASGHTFNTEIDTQPVSWDNLEIRVDEKIFTDRDLKSFGFNVGDYVGIEPQPYMSESGYINARHLDNKAGVACQLAAIKAVVDEKIELPVDCYPLFTITEEEGTGASSVLRGDVASMVAIDNSTVAPGQNSREETVVIAMRDKGGLYDYHLTHHLIRLCDSHNIPHVRDLFRHYKSDATSALSAGNDIRTALICFGLDASHGYERTHIDSLLALTRLVCAHMTSKPEIAHDKHKLGGLDDFPREQEKIDDHDDKPKKD